MEKIVTKILENNRTALFLGKAGTAKSSTIMSVAERLGLPVVTLFLAGIPPEDIGGLIRPDSTTNPKAYTYLAPKWFVENEGKPFLLFLDEINQASIETLHAIFSVVNDRRVAGRVNKKMRVIAAGNTETENEFLTPMPEPLRDRFVYKEIWKPNLDSATEFLGEKYKGQLNGLSDLLKSVRKVGEATPRHVEQAIMRLIDGHLDIETGRYLIGSAYDMWVENIGVTRKVDDERIAFLQEVKSKMKNDYAVIDGKMTKIDKSSLLVGLTEEEKEILGV